MMTTAELEEAAEVLGAELEIHCAECPECIAGDPCDEADDLVTAALEWTSAQRYDLGGEAGGA